MVRLERNTGEFAEGGIDVSEIGQGQCAAGWDELGIVGKEDDIATYNGSDVVSYGLCGADSKQQCEIAKGVSSAERFTLLHDLLRRALTRGEIEKLLAAGESVDPPTAPPLPGRPN